MKQKKLLAAFLAAAMTVACLTQAAIAEPLPQEAEPLAAGDTGSYQAFKYKELDDGTLSITSYTGSDYIVSIPSEIDEKKVTTIGSYAFGYLSNSSIVKIILPDTLTTIEDNAFSACDSMTEITIPAGVTTIGESLFCDCKGLRNIYVNTSNANYKDIGGVLFTKDETKILNYPIGRKDKSYSIPYGTVVIGKAFFDCPSLEEITIPNSVTEIENLAFAACSSLTDIDLPDGLTTIGEQAFYSCSSLTEVTIPNSVTEIGESIFGFCQLLTKVDLPKNMTAIPNGMFEYCNSLAEITIPDSVTIIGDSAFSGTSLTGINLPDGLTTIGEGAFSGTSLTGIAIPDSVTEIKEEAFIYCYSLEKVKLPKSITTIEYATFFNNSNLPEIEIPDNVQSIESRAFLGCPSLKKAVISPYVKTISSDAFSNKEWFGCPDLTIYGYTGTSAESYAKGANIPFVSLGIFLNSESDVSVTADTNVIPDDTKLYVKQTEKTETSVSYNITLTCNGEEIQPKGNVTVRIPVPEGWDTGNIYVYHRDANGKLTEIKATVSGGYIIFTTNHFSEYLLSTTKLVATTPCDVDGSGEVDELDSVALARYLASWDVSIDQSAADVDGNGDIDELDSVMLARKLAGWNV